MIRIRFSTISAPLFTEIEGLAFRRGQWTTVDVGGMSHEQRGQLVKYTGRILGVHPDDEDDYAELAAPPAPQLPDLPATDLAAPPPLAPREPAPPLVPIAPASPPPELEPVAPAPAAAEFAPDPVAVTGDTAPATAPPPAVASPAAIERPTPPLAPPSAERPERTRRR